MSLVQGWKSDRDIDGYAEICRMSQAELQQEIAFLNFLIPKRYVQDVAISHFWPFSSLLGGISGDFVFVLLHSPPQVEGFF